MRKKKKEVNFQSDKKFQWFLKISEIKNLYLNKMFLFYTQLGKQHILKMYSI